jgi:hypothetical protein
VKGQNTKSEIGGKELFKRNRARLTKSGNGRG